MLAHFQHRVPPPLAPFFTGGRFRSTGCFSLAVRYFPSRSLWRAAKTVGACYAATMTPALRMSEGSFIAVPPVAPRNETLSFASCSFPSFPNVILYDYGRGNSPSCTSPFPRKVLRPSDLSPLVDFNWRRGRFFDDAPRLLIIVSSHGLPPAEGSASLTFSMSCPKPV